MGVVRVSGDDRRSIALQEENTLNQDPAWSPDGGEIAYVEAHEISFLHIESFPEGDRILERRLEGQPWNDVNPAWAPDAQNLLISRNEVGVAEQLDYDLHLMSAEGTEEKLLEDERSSYAGTWSPTGDRIVFYGDGELGLDLFVLDLETRTVSLLLQRLGDQIDPEWRP